MHRTLFAPSLFLIALAATPAATKIDKKEYDLASGSISGEVIRGPRVVIAKGLNVLRYNHNFNSAVAYAPTGDLWARLTEVAIPPAQPAVTRAAEPEREKMSARMAELAGIPDPLAAEHVRRAEEIAASIAERSYLIRDRAAKVSANYDAVLRLLTATNTNMGLVRAAGRALISFLAGTTGAPAQTLAGIDAELADKSSFVIGTKTDWPATSEFESLAADTAVSQRILEEQVGTYPSFSADQAKAIALTQSDLQADNVRMTNLGVKAEVSKALAKLQDAGTSLAQAAGHLSSAVSQNATIAARLPELQPGGQKHGDFMAARAQLLDWKSRMETLKSRWHGSQSKPPRNPDPFTLQAEGTCEFAFARTKSTTLTLTRVDQMPGTVNPATETVLSVTVECTSPFSISAGVAFANVDEREFAIQPVVVSRDPTATENRFVAATRSSFHPLPLGMAHVRLCEPYEWFSLHGSFGVAGNFRSQNSGGSDAEFLIGPSLSFFRTMFLTPGLHIGREVSLGGGFREDEPVPSGVTTIPLRKSYKRAFGFAVTFTKP